MIDRIFAGVYPTGIRYSDRFTEENGDYAFLAFLPFSTLDPEWAIRCQPWMRAEIEADMATIQACRGELFEVSACGQTVRLGSRA